jgi:hypothetical protein
VEWARSAFSRSVWFDDATRKVASLSQKDWKQKNIKEVFLHELEELIKHFAA